MRIVREGTADSPIEAEAKAVMFDFPLISKEALIFSLESLTVLNKRAAARRAYPSRMSGAIDLIPMQ